MVLVKQLLLHINMESTTDKDLQVENIKDTTYTDRVNAPAPCWEET